MRQGEQSLSANRWEEATNEFVKAGGLFDESLEVAKRAKAKQAAEAARDSALTEQRKAQEGGASELFPEGVAEAVSLLHQAEQKLNPEDHSTAQAIFKRSTARFQQVCDEAVIHLQREQAEQARARAHEVQDRSSSVQGGRPQRRAHKTLAQGDRLFQQGSYAEARVKYEEAISVLSALLETSLATPAEHKIALVSRPFVLYSVFILGLLSVVIVLYAAKEREQAEREASIAKLLKEARKALEVNQLAAPTHHNAVDSLGQVLELKPNHAEARAILAQVITRYQQLIEEAVKEGKLDQAKAHLMQARWLVRQYGLPDEGLETLAQDIAQREASIAKLLKEAHEALIGGRENVVELAAQVLVLAPGHQGAQQILAEVVTHYVGLGEAALSKNQLYRAKLYYITALGLVQRYQLPDGDVGRLKERIVAHDHQRKQQEASEFAGPTEEQRQSQNRRKRRALKSN